MSEPSQHQVLSRGSRTFGGAAPARWGLFKGLITGAAIEVPTLAATVWVLARLGIGDPDVSFMRIVRLTAVFAGFAAVITAGGIGRLAAHASAEGGRRRAMIVAARAHAAASAGLVIIAAIPHGMLPASSWGWLPLPAAGAIAGALCGLAIGGICGGTAPVGLGDVWSLARRPGGKLRQLLSPDDLVKLGASLRTRTSSLFEGIFDPAPLPPEAAADTPKTADTTASSSSPPADPPPTDPPPAGPK
ncbi:MAG: hypothetical protein AB7O24_27405 [Kofleriaceae bacterium]